MLDQETRTTILKLHSKNLSYRRISELTGVDRKTVKAVVKSQKPTPPRIHRKEKAEPHRDKILTLYTSCKGNLVRVHEELLKIPDVDLSYQALTAFCRRHAIGHKPKVPAGEYHFKPGEEMQHDTSPHTVVIGGKKRKLQTASAVLCYSRMIFFQCFPCFKRFDCKVFLFLALEYFGGAATKIMIDNTNVVVLYGTGRDMIPVPEMEAFGDRYGTYFVAHAIGDANRSGRVERPFHYIENNFFAGRTFTDWGDLNEQARRWCDEKNRSFKRHIKAKPIELFAMEKAHLIPLPEWVPEPERLHHRIVDVGGYVCVHTNRYSVPSDWISRQVQVRETRHEIIITLGNHQSVTHPRVLEPLGQRSTLAGHHPDRRRQGGKKAPPPELETLIKLVPELEGYIADLRKRRKKIFLTPVLRHLLRMVREYPRLEVMDAVREAHHYGLYDLDRLEVMILRRIGQGLFFPSNPEDTHGEDND